MADEVRRILLVDDVKVFLDFERRLLEGAGYEVDAASSGPQALEKAREFRPHVILLDLYMPDMDGAECCRLIKNDDALKDIRVIIITAKPSEEDRLRCAQAGCDGFLSKIVHHEDLLEEIRKLLDAKAQMPSRQPISIEVSYAPVESPERRGRGLKQQGFTRNMSPDGMFIVSLRPMAIGTILELEFELPGLERNFHLRGEVFFDTNGMSQEDLALGFDLRFMNIDKGTSDLIGDYLSEQLWKKPSMPPAEKRRIVVVDDSRFWREKITTILEPSGHEVIAVEDGESAIKLCMDPERPVDLIVLDLLMPRVEGHSVARYLRDEALTKKITIIGFTSAYKSRDFPNGGHEQGLDAILEKSASPDHFLFVFNKYLHTPPLPKGPRPAPRVPTHIPVEYEFGEGRSGHGVIQNVSVTGAYISTFLPLEAGTMLLLSFTLPKGAAVKVSALVVWMNENKLRTPADYSRGMGVVFKLMNQDLISALEDYVLEELVRY